MALLKMSDISNPMKPFNTAAWWADVVLKAPLGKLGLGLGRVRVLQAPLSKLPPGAGCFVLNVTR